LKRIQILLIEDNRLPRDGIEVMLKKESDLHIAATIGNGENSLQMLGKHKPDNEQSVDELWLTIEPKIFGVGGSFVIEEKLDINLQLISCESANKQGTLLTKYTVIKN